MYLWDLYGSVTLTEEIRKIGREFSAYGREYCLAGILNNQQGTQLVLLEYDGDILNEEYIEEPENPTARETLLPDSHMKNGLPELLKTVEIGGEVCKISGWSSRLLDETTNTGDFYVLLKLMEQGFKSDSFFGYPPEAVTVYFISLGRKIESLKNIDLSEKIRFSACETCEEEYPQISFDLEPDKEYNLRIKLFSGKEEVCIKRLHLIDLNEKKEHPEFAEKICPKGMRIPVVEYTGGADLQIMTKAYLDSPYGEFEKGFDTENGVVAVGIQLNTDGGTKSSTVQQTVQADTKRLECEIFHCSRKIDNPQVDEFLI